MDVSSICSERGVQITPLPEGTSMPPASEPTAEQIEVLNSIDGLLDSLKAFQELKTTIDAVLIPPGQEGSLRMHTWEIWAAATGDLAAAAGLPPVDLSLDALVREVVTRLEAENNTQNAGDIARLKGLLIELEKVYGPIEENPLIAEASTHIENRSLRLEIRAVIEQLVQSLPAELRSQVNISEIDWSSPAVSAISNIRARLRVLIQDSCNDYNEMVPEPPIIAPPPPPPPPEKKVEIEYELALSPAYTLSLMGDRGNAMGLSGYAGLQLGFNEKLKLDISYTGMLNLAQDFSYSHASDDSGQVSLTYDPFIIMAGFNYQRDFYTAEDQYLGAAGFGASVPLPDEDATLLPFIGGLAGTAFGGFAGVRGGYSFPNLMDLYVNAQAYYQYLYTDVHNHDVGGQLSAGFSPVEFLGNKLFLGISAGGYYMLEPEVANLSFGLQLGYGSLINPLPMTIEQAAQGGF